MPICEKRKIIFIHIPKCAGSSINKNFYNNTEYYIHNLSTKNDVIKNVYYKHSILCNFIHIIGYIISFIYNPISKLINNNFLVGHAKLINYKDNNLIKYNINDYFIFTVIRNPYSRFFSMYNYLEEALYLNEIEFISYVEKIFINKENDKRYLWFQPQYKFLYNKDNIQINRIIKYENLDKQYNILKKQFNLYDLEHINKSNIKRYIISDFYKIKNMKKRVYKLYKADFKIFNYNKHYIN